MEKYAVIVAGGSGLRMGTATPKQFLLLHNKPLLWYTLHTFLATFPDIHVVLVLPKLHFELGEAIVQTLPAANPIQLVAGGSTRFESVKNGLQVVPNHVIVFVHDGVRCLVNGTLLQKCYLQAIAQQSAIPAVASIDSVRIVQADGKHNVADRNGVMQIQTPQTFNSTLLKAAFEQPYHPSFTDEATVVEAYGTPVFLIEGDYNNIKVTKPLDLLIASHLLLQNSSENEMASQ